MANAAMNASDLESASGSVSQSLPPVVPPVVVDAALADRVRRERCGGVAMPELAVAQGDGGSAGVSPRRSAPACATSQAIEAWWA